MKIVLSSPFYFQTILMNYNPAKIFYGLLGIIFILFLLNLASYLDLRINNLEQNNFFFKKTHFNLEKNIPSIFSSLLHLFSSVLLASVALLGLKTKPGNSFWWGLSFIFFFLSLDELLRIHEKIQGPSGSIMESSGLFLYGWILYYSIGLLIIGMLLIRPFFKLPKITIKRFITAGTIFLFGAVVLENIAGWFILDRNIIPEQINLTPQLFIISTLEELCEMIGVSYFIFGILEFRMRHENAEIITNTFTKTS